MGTGLRIYCLYFMNCLKLITSTQWRPRNSVWVWILFSGCVWVEECFSILRIVWKIWDRQKLWSVRFSDAKKCLGTQRQNGSVKLKRIVIFTLVRDPYYKRLAWVYCENMGPWTTRAGERSARVLALIVPDPGKPLPD